MLTANESNQNFVQLRISNQVHSASLSNYRNDDFDPLKLCISCISFHHACQSTLHSNISYHKKDNNLVKCIRRRNTVVSWVVQMRELAQTSNWELLNYEQHLLLKVEGNFCEIWKKRKFFSSTNKTPQIDLGFLFQLMKNSI